MRILILGGDGYLGWPTAMRFSVQGHEVSIVDNFSRRRWHDQHSTDSLTPIAPLEERIEAWREISSHDIEAYVGSMEDGEFVDHVIARTLPEAIVHYAEQPSAPYSMKSREAAVETQYTNVIGTLKLLFAIRDRVPDCHLVKLGTMGEYGTPNIDIEEGFIEIEHKGRKDVLPFPKMPGSLYHLSKVHDSNNIHFACRVWGLRSTDLNQGVVYGIETEESSQDERLLTRFDYDEYFGTVLNRFCVQAVIGHPLTVYGEGGRRAASSTSATPSSASSLRSPTHRSWASTGSSTSSPSSSRSASSPSWSGTAPASWASRLRCASSRTRASRPSTTTTTPSTPICSTSASTRTISARSWSARCCGPSSATATG